MSAAAAEALASAVAAGAVTAVGGVFALRLRSRMDLLAAVSCGAVLGVALLDLLPEALRLSRTTYDPATVTGAALAGFLLYLAIDQALKLGAEARSTRASLGPASLVAHSLVDGLGIGLAFQVSSVAGWMVAAAVLAHDLLDGANTVVLSLSGGAGARTARRWLAADAVAPLAGAAISTVFRAPPAGLGLLLAVVSGGFLYIGATELLPRGQAEQRRLSALAATAFGAGLIYAILQISGAGG